MERWVGKLAIVTGASSGMGGAIVQRLVEKGMNVVGMARRYEKVEELAEKLKDAPGKLCARKVDLRIEEDIKEAFEWSTKKFGALHLLVNTAGSAIETTLIDGDVSKWRANIDTNILGTSMCIKEGINIMRSNNVDGHIILINDCGAHTINFLPFFNVYPCTRFALRNLMECWRQELLKLESKIKTSAICPGITKTIGINDYTEDVVEWFNSRPGLNIIDIADTIEFIITRPEHCLVYDLIIKPRGEPFL